MSDTTNGAKANLFCHENRSVDAEAINTKVEFTRKPGDMRTLEMLHADLTDGGPMNSKIKKITIWDRNVLLLSIAQLVEIANVNRVIAAAAIQTKKQEREQNKGASTNLKDFERGVCGG